jgi:hypothetical protein
MTTLIRVLFVSLLSFAATPDAMAYDCGDCPGDKAEAHEHVDAEAKAAAPAPDAAEGAAAEAPACSCAKGKTGETTWCAACKVGYHEGNKIGCEGCFKKASGQSDKACEKCAGAKKPDDES